MAVTFIHTADWQLAKPYARVKDDLKRSRLQQERIECIKRIAIAVTEHSASFVVVAGDIFDSPSPTKATVSAACSAIGAMQVPVLVIPGNHDHGGPGSLWEQPFFLSEQQQLAPNLRVLLKPEPVVLDQVVIFPAPLLRRHEMVDTTTWIRSAFVEPEFPSDLARIVLAHGSVQGFGSAADDEDESSAAINLIDLGRLPIQEIDYVALGDWHGRKQIDGKTWYSGTPEIDRFPKGEGNEPGYILKVTVGRGQNPVVEKLPTARFNWHQLDYRFLEDASLDAFTKTLDEMISTHGPESLMRLGLEGSLGIAASESLRLVLEALEARLLRLKLDNQVTIAPTSEEIEGLTQRAGDPLVASVASQLAAMVGDDRDGIVGLALRELYSACGGGR